MRLTIAATPAAGMTSLPKYSPLTEAFAALEAGATAPKLFPAGAASPVMLRAQRAVLPREVPVLAVGSVSPDTMSPWHAAVADGFGLGSALYRIVADADQEHAAAFVTVWGAGA